MKNSRACTERPFDKDIYCCNYLDELIDDCRIAIEYFPIMREHLIKMPREPMYPVTSGEGPQVRYSCSAELMHYCPMCGKKLVKSLREKYFKTLEEYVMNIHQKSDLCTLEKFNTDKWWKNSGL